MDTQADEAALLARIRAGDKAACDTCIQIHFPAVYRLALRLTRDPHEAEDVAQETFLNAFRAIGTFDGRARLGTWLYRIATNTALMRLRAASLETVPVDDPDDGEITPPELYDWCCLPEKDLERAEVRVVVERAISELPAGLRTVFVLRELEGFSTEEAAEALAVSTAVVKTRLHRARVAMREHLASYFSERTISSTIASTG